MPEAHLLKLILALGLLNSGQLTNTNEVTAQIKTKTYAVHSTSNNYVYVVPETHGKLSVKGTLTQIYVRANKVYFIADMGMKVDSKNCDQKICIDSDTMENTLKKYEAKSIEEIVRYYELAGDL